MTKKASHITSEIADQCLAFRARVTSRDITKLYDDAMRPLGLRSTQLSILVAVAEMGSPTPSRIGEMLHLDRSTLSRTLERLKKNGWLEELAADDGRSRPVKLSAAGAAIIRKAHPLWLGAQKQARQLLLAQKEDPATRSPH